MEHEDLRERRSPEEREAALMKALPALVSHVFATAPGFRRHRKPPVMAEPEQAGDDEADRQRDDRLRIDANQVDPVRRLFEAAGFRQIIGEQRHGNAEDGVAQHLQPAHFEKIGLRQICPLALPVRLAATNL